MDVALGVVNGCFATGVSSVVDILEAATFLQRQDGGPGEEMRVRVVGPSPEVVAANGMRIPTSGGFDELAAADIVVVPALGALDEAQVIAALSTPDVRDLVAALTDLEVDRQTAIAGACTGSFALAEAGLLDHRAATTSWWLGRLFRARYRQVDLTADRMVVRDGNVITAGAAFAHVDLALALVGTHSPHLADRVARFLVIDDRPAQSAYLAIDHLAAHDTLVAGFDGYIRTHLADGLDIDGIARLLGTTRRTLERRIGDVLGMSPLKAIQRRRVERARHLMATTDESMERIAAQVGYRNASTLRALLRKHR